MVDNINDFYPTNMEKFASQMYQDLISLCKNNEGFFYKDAQLDSIKYRIFNYHLCSYEQFHNYPSALNCRGTMFNITDQENVRLVCLPPEKFFNYEEGDGHRIHASGIFGVQMEKLDGSLISTYLHPIDGIRLKSKAALASSQAVQAATLLNDQYREEIEEIVRRNYTVNFEYTSPANHIVLYYPESELRVLSIRSHSDGETLFGDRLVSFLQENHFPVVLQHVVSFTTVSNSVTHQQLVGNIRKEVQGEGYVIEIIPPDRKSYLVKIKTEKYLLLHQTKFNARSNRYFFQCVINEQTDDLRSLFMTEEELLRKIKDMERKIQPIYNQLIRTVEQFYEENKHLPRKDYALKAINEGPSKIYLSLIMNLYVGKENDYKKFSINHMRDIFHVDEDETTSVKVDDDQE